MKTHIVSIIISTIVLSTSALFAMEDKEPALAGHCPVAYHKMDKAVKGSEEFSATHEGKTYYFVKAEAKEIFEKDPDAFVPAYDGWCAYGLAHGKKIESDPTAFSVIDGKLYLNKNDEVRTLFLEDPEKFIKQADEQWEKMDS